MKLLQTIKKAYKYSMSIQRLRNFLSEKDIRNGTIYYMVMLRHIEYKNRHMALRTTRIYKYQMDEEGYINLYMEDIDGQRIHHLKIDPLFDKVNQQNDILTINDEEWDYGYIYVTKDILKLKNIIKNAVKIVIKIDGNSYAQEYYNIYKELMKQIKKSIIKK